MVVDSELCHPTSPIIDHDNRAISKQAFCTYQRASYQHSTTYRLMLRLNLGAPVLFPAYSRTNQHRATK